MGFEYKTVKVEGKNMSYEQAALKTDKKLVALQKKGWKVIVTGYYSHTLERPKTANK